MAGHHRVEAEVGVGHGDARGGFIARQDQLVAAVAGQRQFQQGAGKAGAFVDQRKQASRRHIQAREGAAQQADGFAHQPMALVGNQGGVAGQNGCCIALRLDQPDADVQLVGAHLQDRVFQLTRHRQRVPAVAGGFDGGDVGGLGAAWRLDGEGGGALGAVDVDRDVLIAQRVSFDSALQRVQRHALGVRGAVALGRQGQGAFLHLGGEHRRLGDVVHQAPVLGLLTAHAFLAGAEDVGQVMAHMALVRHPRQAAGARQHAQQGYFRQAHGAGAVIDQDDLVAGQGQFITAAGAGAVDGRQELQATVLGRVFQAVAGFIGELAEVDLPGMAGDAEHEDVGTRAEHFLFGAGDHHGAHFGVLEADAADRVVQLHVHPQVIAVELELVARAQAGVLVDVDLQRSDRAVKAQFDVPVLGRVGLVFNAGGSGDVAHVGSPKGGGSG